MNITIGLGTVNHVHYFSVGIYLLRLVNLGISALRIVNLMVTPKILGSMVKYFLIGIEGKD